MHNRKRLITFEMHLCYTTLIANKNNAKKLMHYTNYLDLVLLF